MTIARVLLSGEARAGDVPGEHIANYRELVRLHAHLSDESARSQNEIQALVVVLFPELTQVFADPCLRSRARRAQDLSQRSGHCDSRGGADLSGVANPGASARMARPLPRRHT